MRKFQNNAKWLVYFAPFRALSISAAYLVPFFSEKGMSQSDIFLLQSVFSLTVVLLEVPSGWLADKIGRALVIQISAPIAAASMIGYGLSDQYWQFVLFEILLAVASVCISGADQALLIDSLKADGKEDNYVRVAQRMHSWSFAGIVAGLPVSMLVVKLFGVSATLIADGMLTAIGALLVLRLVEPPIHEAEELSGASAWQATKQLLRTRESRWLIALTVMLGASTYIGAWVAAPYYTSIGVPVVAFAAIYAGRNLLKSLFSHRISIENRLKSSMGVFSLLSALPYLAMATGLPWLAFMLVGHDLIHALQAPALAHRYNKYISSRYRAMLNSIVGLQSRLVFAVLGPLVGLAMDGLGLQAGFLLIGAGFGAVIGLIYWKAVKSGALD